MSYKIISKFIKDISFEIPDVQTFVMLEKEISKYNLNFDIKSKSFKENIIEVNTIFLIFFTAATGIYFARLQGLNTIRAGFNQLIKNEIPIYEIISGAALAFAALLLIIPGFLTDLIGFLLIVPVTRKIFIKIISSKFNRKKENGNIIEGSFDENNHNNKD